MGCNYLFRKDYMVRMRVRIMIGISKQEYDRIQEHLREYEQNPGLIAEERVIGHLKTLPKSDRIRYMKQYTNDPVTLSYYYLKSLS